MNTQKLCLVILCITSILLTISPSVATYDVVSGIASNNTVFTTSANYGELHNITLATGTGVTFLKASWDAQMNFSAPLYARFMRDGVSLGRFNLTQSVYAQVGSYEIAFNETTGTHQYGWEVYSNKKGTIYSRNFSAVFLRNGTYGTGTGGAGNISSITGEPVGVLDCTGTDEVTCTVTAPTTWTTTQNTTYESQISILQSNDTADRSYVNNTFLPITTYSGNYPNTSLINYLLITTYGGNFPNNSLSNYLLTSLFGGNFNTSFHAEVPVCTGNEKLTSSDGETITCISDPDNTSSFSLNIEGGNAITGAALLIEGTGVDFVQSGNNITISMPAAGITNGSVNPQNMNASNLTSGTVPQARLPSIPEANLTLNYATHAQAHTLNGTDHTGNLNYSRVDNVRVNLTSGANVTGLLPDANLASTFVKTVSGTSPIVSSGGVNPTISLTTTWSEQQNFTGGINTTGTILGNYPNNTLGSKESTWDAKEPAISQGVSPQFWMFNKTWQNITTTLITEGTNQWFTNASAISAVQSILNAMNTSSADNNTNSIARDDIINSTKVNKTNAGELSGGTLAYSIFPINITIGTGGISFSNGTNNISTGTKKKMRQSTNGFITALYVNQTDDDECSGNITISSFGTNKAYIAWSGVANASSTGLSATFTSGEWLLYNMTENTGCKDLTLVQAHTKTS